MIIVQLISSTGAKSDPLELPRKGGEMISVLRQSAPEWVSLAQLQLLLQLI
jgi:hypothetical protein